MIVTSVFKEAFRGQEMGTIFAMGEDFSCGIFFFDNKELRKLQ